MAGELKRLPAELRALDQWVLAGADKVPKGEGLRRVSPTRPSEWMSHERAVELAEQNRELVTTHVTSEGVTVSQTGLDLGFVLHESDGYTCIDLDVKDAETHPDKPEVWTTPDDFQRFVNIISTMDSYTERSRSGKGIHVWVTGDIGRGFHRGGVEVYSRERYIICTGDVYVDKPVADRSSILVNMVEQMRPTDDPNEALEELPPETDDWYVFQVAATASNSDKFWELWRGAWNDLGFPSQSEADLALMSMFTFYSDSNEQCRRLFRASALGQREKATKDDRYVNRTLKIIRKRQSAERAADLSAIVAGAEFVAGERSRLAEAVAEAQGGSAGAVPEAERSRVVAQLGEPGQGDPPQAPPPSSSALAQLAPVSPEVAAAGEEGLKWPPGFVGSIARFVYENSYLPVKEVSVVAALGLMAGLAGKAWHIPQSGLNLYIILIARSAIGKEAMHSGLAAITQSCQQRFPFFGNFVDFTEYVSGPALTKACLQHPSFVNVAGEWGRRLRRLSGEDGRDGPLQTLRTQMTNLYQKSGPQSIAGGLGYSNADASVESVSGVAYSMIGESTPGTFYDSLTESMMEDGFLSRFLVVPYHGDRPRRGSSMLEEPDDALVESLCSIADHALDMINRESSMPVGRTEEAAQIMAAFDDEAHQNITATDEESQRQMWNRAALKAMRVAALLAVGDHYLSPCINRDHIEWAIHLVRRDISVMSDRLEKGDVGSGDRARERKLVAVIRKFINMEKVPSSYRVKKQMHSDGIIPRAYIQQRTQQISSFLNHKLGPTRALDEALNHCVANGWLMEAKHDALVQLYNHHGKAYRVLDLPDYGAVGRN